MKKVGLITYHAAHNNGSFLQAYALQKKISSMEGYDCEIINYVSQEQKDLYAVWRKNTSIREIAKNVLILFHYKFIKQRHLDFQAMQKKLNLSGKEYHTIGELSEVENKYDIFVSGSDQIWNMQAWDYSDAYFLCFVTKKKKISYASSFGGFTKNIPKESENRIKNFLDPYSNIGVREKIAKDFIENISKKHPEIVLDPTFLLDCKDYEDICSERLVSEDYIFLYAIFAIEFNESIMKVAKRFSEIYQLPVYVLYTGNKVYRVKKYGFKILDHAAPNHFLSMIKYAKYVLSSSFHGTAFSIIFQKQFYVLRGNNHREAADDDRLCTVLETFGLEWRQLDENSSKEKYFQDQIDYEIITSKLAAVRKKSMEFLAESLKDEG